MLTDAAVFPARIGPLGYAFVKFERLEDAIRAFEALNNTVCCRWQLVFARCNWRVILNPPRQPGLTLVGTRPQPDPVHCLPTPTSAGGAPAQRLQAAQDAVQARQRRAGGAGGRGPVRPLQG